ncbi:MAG: hypothetical protein WC907_07910 [Acholeplasmataceae bacterium]
MISPIDRADIEYNIALMKKGFSQMKLIDDTCNLTIEYILGFNECMFYIGKCLQLDEDILITIRESVMRGDE